LPFTWLPCHQKIIDRLDFILHYFSLGCCYWQKSNKKKKGIMLPIQTAATTARAFSRNGNSRNLAAGVILPPSFLKSSRIGGTATGARLKPQQQQQQSQALQQQQFTRSFSSRFRGGSGGGGGGFFGSSMNPFQQWPIRATNTILNVVPQGFKFVVERFGKLHSIQGSGLFFAIPMVDLISYVVDVRERMYTLNTKEIHKPKHNHRFLCVNFTDSILLPAFPLFLKNLSRFTLTTYTRRTGYTTTSGHYTRQCLGRSVGKFIHSIRRRGKGRIRGLESIVQRDATRAKCHAIGNWRNGIG
jgi:hypothetical protein